MVSYVTVKFLGVAGSFVIIIALFLIGIIISFEVTFQTIANLFKTQEPEAEPEEENVIPQFRSMEDGGDISVWDGHEIDYDTYDSTTDDIKWDITSVTQLK
jgi:hypothetical protein